MPILELHHIYKNYLQGDLTVPVLKDISLSVEKGEYLAIMGPSGSGKSTLMNIIGCLDRATSGTMILAGKEIEKCSENEMSELRLNKIGFIFQNFQLLPGLSALENVALPLTYAKIRKKERLKWAKEMLEKVGLGDRIYFKPSQLSGGQKQRVAIARAMINSPDILLADEPTGALDSASGKQVMELFQALNNEGVTVIMITHDAKIAEHAKKTVTIYDGILSEPKKEML